MATDESQTKNQHEDSDTRVWECGVCGTELVGIDEKIDHEPCPDASPVRDTEGEWREEKRRDEHFRREHRREMKRQGRGGVL